MKSRMWIRLLLQVTSSRRAVSGSGITSKVITRHSGSPDCSALYVFTCTLNGKGGDGPVPREVVASSVLTADGNAGIIQHP